MFKTNAENHARGILIQKTLYYGDVPLTWVAKSAFWYMNDPLLSKCKKSEKTSECQFTRKRVKATQKKLLSTRKREKREKKSEIFSLEKE